jgi:quercetin dioxygenase-like cupin family protein
MTVKPADSVPAEGVRAGTDTRFQVLIGPDQGPHFAMRRFIMQPGGGMPRHTNEVEHEQYVLRGRARVGIGDQIFDVKRDDVVFIPAGTPHWYEAAGDEPFEFLCVVPNKPDRIQIVGGDSG